MWDVTGHLLRRSGGVCALISMERCPIAGVGLRRLHHAFMVRDGADRRIQRSHVACSLTWRRPAIRYSTSASIKTAPRLVENHTDCRAMGVACSCRGGDTSLLRCKYERKLSNGRRAADPAHDIRIRGRHAMRPQHRTCMAKQETPRFQTRPDTSVALAIGGKRGGSRRLGTCGHACGTYAHSTGNPRQRWSYAHPWRRR